MVKFYFDEINGSFYVWPSLIYKGNRLSHWIEVAWLNYRVAFSSITLHGYRLRKSIRQKYKNLSDI